MTKTAPGKGPRIVIVGGGAGGVELATRLGRDLGRHKADVILVDRNPAHLWKPRLHEVAVGLIGSGDDETSYLAHGHTHSYEFSLGDLIGLDTVRRTIRVSGVKSTESDEQILDARDVAYDTLVLALGSRVNDFGITGVLEHCHMLDTPAQAQHLQRSFLEAAVQVTMGRLDRLRIGIVGAGATGVELAAELHHAVHAMERYGGLGAAGRLDITLIDRADRVLPAVDPQTSEHALAALQRLGVKVLLGQGVERVTRDAFHLTNGETVPCEIKVWASGVTGHDIVDALAGLTLSKGKRIAVDSHLACIGVENIFAIGDCAAAAADGGAGLLPPTAQVAHQQAAYLARSLARRMAGKSVTPFRFRPRGTLVSLGADQAAGEIPTRRNQSVVPLRGILAKLLYVSLYHMHRVTLHGWLRAIALFLADRLRRTTLPPVKLH